MKTSLFLIAVEIIVKRLFSLDYKWNARQRPEDFSRTGKIGFVDMIAITLNFLKKSIQQELRDFFSRVRQEDIRVSKQAYLEARYKLKPEAFSILLDDTMELAAHTPEMKKFHGFRVLAIDGSLLNLEDTPALRGHFGTNNGCAAARISAVADVLNEGIYLDARIGKTTVSEKDYALLHHLKIAAYNIEKPVLLYDRGYASAEMFSDLLDKKLRFVFRLKRKFNHQIDQLPIGDHTVTVVVKRKLFTLRVVKFRLESGVIETLVTNLTPEEMPAELFPELYNLRWGIETAYRSVKKTLQLENFSGTSPLFVKQDFYAIMFLKNMVAFAKWDANKTISETENKDNKHPQKTNENLLVGDLKDKLIIAMLESNPIVRAKLILDIIQEAARNKIPLRPGRSFPRKRKHSKRFHNSGKSAL